MKQADLCVILLAEGHKPAGDAGHRWLSPPHLPAAAAIPICRRRCTASIGMLLLSALITHYLASHALLQVRHWAPRHSTGMATGGDGVTAPQAAGIQALPSCLFDA